MLIQGAVSKVMNRRRVTIAVKAANGTNINASEETKDVWKWSAIPRTMRDQAATTARRERRRMLKMECMVKSGREGSEWNIVVVVVEGCVWASVGILERMLCVLVKAG